MKKKFIEREWNEEIKGEFDEEGFFTTPNGSFWDPDYVYFNREGYDKHGGYYDEELNYIPGEGWDEINKCYFDDDYYNNYDKYYDKKKYNDYYDKKKYNDYYNKKKYNDYNDFNDNLYQYENFEHDYFKREDYSNHNNIDRAQYYSGKNFY